MSPTHPSLQQSWGVCVKDVSYTMTLFVYSYVEENKYGIFILLFAMTVKA